MGIVTASIKARMYAGRFLTHLISLTGMAALPVILVALLLPIHQAGIQGLIVEFCEVLKGGGAFSPSHQTEMASVLYSSIKHVHLVLLEVFLVMVAVSLVGASFDEHIRRNRLASPVCGTNRFTQK